jgi:hypothetical protein
MFGKLANSRAGYKKYKISHIGPEMNEMGIQYEWALVGQIKNNMNIKINNYINKLKPLKIGNQEYILIKRINRERRFFSYNTIYKNAEEMKELENHHMATITNQRLKELL